MCVKRVEVLKLSMSFEKVRYNTIRWFGACRLITLVIRYSHHDQAQYSQRVFCLFTFTPVFHFKVLILVFKYEPLQNFKAQ